MNGREYSVFSEPIYQLITAQINFYVYFFLPVKTQSRCFSKKRVYSNYYDMKGKHGEEVVFHWVVFQVKIYY